MIDLGLETKVLTCLIECPNQATSQLSMRLGMFDDKELTVALERLTIKGAVEAFYPNGVGKDFAMYRARL